jgi:hypothetical protein
MEKSIENHLEDYKLACEKLNISSELPNVPHLPIGLQNFILSKIMLPILIKAERGDWVPDFNNYSQWKYYPWWDMETYGDDTAGSGFSLNGVYCDGTGTCIGAPFVFEHEVTAKEFAEKYIDLYRFIMKDIQF